VPLSRPCSSHDSVPGLEVDTEAVMDSTPAVHTSAGLSPHPMPQDSEVSRYDDRWPTGEGLWSVDPPPASIGLQATVSQGQVPGDGVVLTNPAAPATPVSQGGREQWGMVATGTHRTDSSASGAVHGSDGDSIVSVECADLRGSRDGVAAAASLPNHNFAIVVCALSSTMCLFKDKVHESEAGSRRLCPDV
jgi:hypothetical protein